MSGCGSVTRYWCSTGMAGTSSPTIAPVCRAWLPVALTTCSHTTSPRSVRTRHSPPGVRSMAVTFVRRWISAPPVAGAAGERLGEVGGLDVAVLGVKDGPDEAVHVAEGPDLPHLARGQELDPDPDGARDPGVEAVLVHSVAARREADVPDRPEPHFLPRLALELRVQAHRVLVDLPHAVAHVEQGQEPRRVPGGARGELRPLAQDHVRPALAGEVVERRDADDAAADDDHPGMRLHGTTPATRKWGGTVARFGSRGKSPWRASPRAFHTSIAVRRRVG